MDKIGIIGGGSFGTAISILLAKKGYDINIYDKNLEVIKDINNNRVNSRYLPTINIPSQVIGKFSQEETIKDCKYIVLAVPSQVVRYVAKSLKGYVNKDIILISIAKGIEENSFKRLSVVIEEELPGINPVILSGPSHAEEVAIDIPTAVVVSSLDMNKAKLVQDLFMTSKFRVYTNPDIIGIEIGGAVKNIIALAAGISDGIGYGDNSKAALLTRGMNEITRIGIKLGGLKETFAGLTGMGDLIVTCTSIHSRNRRAGMLIGQGAKTDEAISKVGMIVEGISACKAFYHLKEQMSVYMPITDTLYKILFENLKATEAVDELMLKDKKNEN
ncbi:MAG TPA: NAD(P)H-dependent glycerol-3-phosphate dehydrogenase [Clostridiaceae bacterium]